MPNLYDDEEVKEEETTDADSDGDGADDLGPEINAFEDPDLI